MGDADGSNVGTEVGVYDGVIDIDGAFKSSNIVADFIRSFATTGGAATGVDVGIGVTGVAEGPVVWRGSSPAI